jgi:pimeloyl-ACP methyl ester carboxylesterase
VTFVLIPGAGGRAWYWHRVVPELTARGHEVVAVDLPADDDTAGWAEYTDAVVNAIGAPRPGLVLVAQSMGGFTAPLVCARVPVDLLVLVNAMVPVPGETGGEWWANTGQGEAAAAFAREEGRPEEFDFVRDFFHDVPKDVFDEAMAMGDPPQSATPFGQPWPGERWPDVPTRFVQGRDDRMFPLTFQRRVVGERLGVEVDDLPGGHLIALSRPAELAQRLDAYLKDRRS